MAKKPTKELSETKASKYTPPATSAALPEGVSVIRRITLSVLSFKDVGTKHIVKVQGPLRESQMKNQKDGMKAAWVCPVVDCETGEEHMMVAGAVVKGNFDENYPDDTYVGKTFFLQNNGKRKPGQRYNDYTIMEVDATQLAA